MPTIPTIPRYVSLPSVLKMAHNPVQALQKFIDQYGPSYYVYVGGVVKTLITTDPVLIQHVMQRNHRNYEKSAMQTDVLAQYLGRGLLTNTGSDWLRQRRLIQPGFHRERLVALTEIMQEVIDQEITAIRTELKASDQAVDVYPKMLNFAFRIVAKAIYSEDIDEMELRDFGDLITKIQEYVIKEIRLPFLYWYFQLSGKRALHLQLAQDTIDLQRKLIQKRRDSGKRRDDLLQMLLDSRYEDTGEPMDENQLIDEIAILFVAGYETSANALSWTLYLLAQHDEVRQKVLAELQAVVPDRAPGFDDLRQLTYLTQVINESMRLYPPAWITDRVALADDEVAGVHIPKGTVVAPFIYGVHHRKAFYEDPEQFRPERFAPGTQKDLPAFAFMPFGGGPRLCIGNSFAMMEMQLVLAAFLRQVDFRLDPDQVVSARPLITLRPRHGILMYLHENKAITLT